MGLFSRNAMSLVTVMARFHDSEFAECDCSKANF